MNPSLTSDGVIQRSAIWRERTNSRVWWLWYVALLTALVAVGTILFLVGPQAAALAWMVYVTGAILILFKPRYGLYLILFLALVGDVELMPWYPFAKNFSSRESTLFVHDALIISPLETYVLLTYLSWLIRGALRRRLAFFRGELFWPVMVFLGFVVVGFVYGAGSGGNLTIALWEMRALFYLPAMLVLTSNLLQKRAHVSHLIWAAMLALLVEGIIGSVHFVFTLRGNLAGIQATTEHSAAIHMNSLFVLVLAAWLFSASMSKRIGLLMIVPIVALTYLTAQRRAAFLTLGIALVLIAAVLYREKRHVFWTIVPPIAAVLLIYTILFWNGSGPLSIPAQAVKSIVALEQASTEDFYSNIYREMENLNTSFTLHQRPLTGVGFGQKFYILVPLPDISSFFDWWEYLTHNSILWVWLKAGVGGFVSMLVLVGMAVSLGAGLTLRLDSNDLRAVALAATLYLIMHFIYAYADISWDAQSMVYVGAMMGVLNCLERIVEDPVRSSPSRLLRDIEVEPLANPEKLGNPAG